MSTLTLIGKVEGYYEEGLGGKEIHKCNIQMLHKTNIFGNLSKYIYFIMKVMSNQKQLSSVPAFVHLSCNFSCFCPVLNCTNRNGVVSALVKCIPILCTLLQWMLVYFLPVPHLQPAVKGYEVDLSIKRFLQFSYFADRARFSSSVWMVWLWRQRHLLVPVRGKDLFRLIF